MENEIKAENLENLLHINEYFKLEYPGENIEKNKLFEEFKKRELFKYGKDAKLFKCKKDNLCFYLSKENCEVYPFYYKNCPLCNNYICYFCERISIVPLENIVNCCIKSKLNYIFSNSIKYIKGENQINEISKIEFCTSILLQLIPFFNIFLSFLITSEDLLFGLVLKDKNWNYDINILDKKRYLDYFKKYYSFYLIGSIDISIGIFFSVCYCFLDIYFKIFIFLISFFTKFYPLKFYIGITTFATRF